MSDRLALAHAIEDAGIPREKAEGMATAIARFIEGSVATKQDMQAVRADVQASEAALKADIAGLRADLKADIAELGAALKAQPNALMLRLGGLIVVGLGVLFTALHLWPPHVADAAVTAPAPIAAPAKP
jgi:hypothetical protein